MQLHLEEYPPMRTVSLIATGSRQSETGWARLRTELAAGSAKSKSPDRRRGYALAAIGLLMLAWPLAAGRHARAARQSHRNSPICCGCSGST